jgi:transcriptional regulator with XRE-family HTH domain
MNKNEIRNIFSINLKILLERHHIKRKKLANDLNITYSRVCDWSRARTLPTEAEMIKIAAYFDVSVAELKKEFDIKYVGGPNRIEYNDEKKRVRVYDLNRGTVVAYEEISLEFAENEEYVHIMILVPDNLMYPKYNINDLVLLKNVFAKDIDEGDYLINSKDSEEILFIHIYCLDDKLLISPLNINNSKNLRPFELTKDEINKKYEIFKAIAVTKKI